MLSVCRLLPCSMGVYVCVYLLLPSLWVCVWHTLCASLCCLNVDWIILEETWFTLMACVNVLHEARNERSKRMAKKEIVVPRARGWQANVHHHCCHHPIEHILHILVQTFGAKWSDSARERAIFLSNNLLECFCFCGRDWVKGAKSIVERDYTVTLYNDWLLLYYYYYYYCLGLND